MKRRGSFLFVSLKNSRRRRRQEKERKSEAFLLMSVLLRFFPLRSFAVLSFPPVRGATQCEVNETSPPPPFFFNKQKNQIIPRFRLLLSLSPRFFFFFRFLVLVSEVLYLHEWMNLK